MDKNIVDRIEKEEAIKKLLAKKHGCKPEDIKIDFMHENPDN